MGVIHKLTEEVINFILEKKKEDPKIGCRSLSDIVSERFSRKISKSSIGAVLKEHGLSGSIGRPASSGGQKRATFSIPHEKKVQLFGADHAEATQGPLPTQEEKLPKSKEIKDDRPQLRADPIQGEATETASHEAPSQKERKVLPAQARDTFLDEVEIIREKERQEAGADLLSVGAIFVHAAAHHLGLVSMMSNLLRQHVSSELPASLDQICSAVLALRFLGVESEGEIHSSKTEVVWAMNGKNLKDPVRDFWKQCADTQLPKRFDLIFKNEIEQQMAHGAFFKIATENEAPIMIDAQLSRLGGNNAALASPIAKALDVLSETIIANNRPAIIENVDNSDNAIDQLKRLMSAFCRPEARLKKADVINAAGESMASFSQIPRKRRDFIIGLNSTNRLFDIAAPSLKWGTFSPLYHRRLDRVYRMAQFDSAALAEEMRLPQDLFKTVVLAQEPDDGVKIALISNIKATSSAAIAEQFLNRWPVFESNGHKFKELDIDGINNTLESIHIDSPLAGFSLLADLASKYLSKTVFDEISNISDVTSLDRILYTINGKILAKNDHIKALINSYQPDNLNVLLRSASFSLTRLHIADQNRRNIIVLANR